MTTAALAVAVNWFSSRIVENLVDRRFQTIAESAAAQVSGLIDTATGVLREQRSLAAQGLLPLDEPMALGRRLAERLRQQPRLAWISYGSSERDRFVGATRRPDGSILVNHSEAAINDGRPSEAVALPDGHWVAVTESVKGPYSVIAQNWFKDAVRTDGIVVTGPYTFAEGRRGLTLSLRWVDQAGKSRGAFTVDFFFDELSRGLASLIGDRGDAVLLDIDGRLLASAGTVRPPAYAEAALAALNDNRAAILAEPAGSSIVLEVAAPGGQLRTTLTRIDSHLPVQWVLAVLERRATLFAPLHRLHIVIGIVSAVVAVVGLLAAVFLARRLATPLDALSAEADRIRRFDLEGPVEARSGIVELANLIDAMAAMKASLRSFGRFVPRDIVANLIATGGTAALGGERREITILFSDIAGFTSLSERMPPELVLRHSSRYFDVMSQKIHDHAGVIDKFIGDAIMAIWNTPQPDPDHAVHACQALLACMRANEDLDREAMAAGLPALPTRFALHTGEAVVGNVGSTDRMQYTALGANVNLASRLEALNKHYGSRNLVSGETRGRVGDAFIFRSVAIVVPVGTTRAIEVVELLGAATDPDSLLVSEWVSRWEKAMAALRTGQAGEALRQFQILAAERPADNLAAYYVARSATMSRDASKTWDGVDNFAEI
jgi:adenylate cyclase